ncbi:MAG: BolA family transcriptional regulator [Halobacteriovoraceae bacterium]|nr:BolA family transcriptional regulator [Halobacteriovoraceae bacterium]
MEFQKVKNLITAQLPDAEVEITDLTGTSDHLGLQVKSSAFAGKMLLEQHRMVMNILKESFKNELHAVQIKTMTK